MSYEAMRAVPDLDEGDMAPQLEAKAQEALLLDEPLPVYPSAGPTREEWRALTSLPFKVDEYSHEVYFRQAWRDVARVFTSRAAAVLQSLAIVVFKPDAVVARRIEPSLAFFARNGFVPVAHCVFRYNEWSVRETWRYQSNQFTLDRIGLSTMVCTAGESLLVVFRDDARAESLPASLRLQVMKGPSMPLMHEEWHLRRILRSTNRVFKFVHTPDEPADIVRELGVALTPEERHALLDAIALGLAGTDGDALRDRVARLHAAHAAHDLDPGASWQRLGAALEASRGECPALVDRIDDAIRSCLRGRRISFAAFHEALQRTGAHVEIWDEITVGAQFAHQSYEGVQARIRDHGTEGWLDGSAQLLHGDAMDFPCFQTQ